jgi:hypothetical protein
MKDKRVASKPFFVRVMEKSLADGRLLPSFVVELKGKTGNICFPGDPVPELMMLLGKKSHEIL